MNRKKHHKPHWSDQIPTQIPYSCLVKFLLSINQYDDNNKDNDNNNNNNNNNSSNNNNNNKNKNKNNDRCLSKL